NTIRAEPGRLRDDLSAAGEEVERPRGQPPLSTPEALVVRGRLGPVALEQLAAGDLVAQSRGAQAVVALLDPQPGERVLDLCAGPGIKTTAIAARVGELGEVRSIEADPRRAEEIEALCARVGASNVRVQIGDATEADLGS